MIYEGALGLENRIPGLMDFENGQQLAQHWDFV